MPNSSLEGFIINGIAAVDIVGYSVSNAGDVNGDGLDDLIIAGSGSDPNGDASGQSYVVFGSSSGFASPLNLSTLNGSNGFKINGIAVGDQAGYSVSGAGDINGDGIDDVIIGANRADSNGVDAGQSYVIFGSRSGFAADFNLSALNGSNGFKVNGIAAGDRSGTSVSRAGDINGDGFDDVIIGARSASPNGENSGQSYVVFGKAGGFSANVNLATLNGTNGFILNGVEAGDNSGVSVSGAGDVNGDGIDDLIIGASADPLGATPPNPDNTSPGQSYVVFGSRDGFGSNLDLADLDGSNGFKINGISADDRSGYAVSNAGDINGDGIDDVLIGSYFASPNGISYAGQSYVVFGNRDGFGSSLDLADLNGSNGFKINGIATYDVSGAAISSAGDVNGDGLDDLLIGAPYASPGGKFKAGQSYVVFGSRDGFGSSLDLADLDGSNGFKINGILAGDISGVAVSTAGDVNGDGLDDLVIGAAYASPNGNLKAGQSYVVFGRVGIGSSGTFELSQLVSSSTVRGTPGNDILVGTLVADLIEGLDGNDGIFGLDGNDQIFGGAGVDILIGGGGNDQLFGEDDNDVIFGDVQLVGGVSGNDFISGGNGDDVVFGGAGNDTINGDAGNDVLDGEDGNDFLNGSNGLDVLTGGNGDDILLGGTGDDRLFGDAGNDTLYGENGNDVLFCGAGDDSLLGGAGDDSLFGEAGNDVLNGEEGNDIINGGDGQDTLFGGSGNDRFFAGSGNDQVFGGDGNDLADGETGDDFLYGGNGNDVLFGNLGNDTLIGEAGDDILVGSDDNDSLSGGDGNDILVGVDPNIPQFGFGKGEIDILTGGSGSDTFVLGENGNIPVDNGTASVPIERGFPAIYYLGKGNDDYALITDFKPGEDVILLPKALIGTGSFTFSQSSGDSGTGISFNNDLIAIVQGVSTVDLLLGNSFSFV